MTNLQLAIQFFLQLAVILMFCRVVGMVAAATEQKEDERRLPLPAPPLGRTTTKRVQQPPAHLHQAALRQCLL